MATIFRSLHGEGNAALPISQREQKTADGGGLRKRIISLCQMYPSDSRSSDAATSSFSWSVRRSKSMSAIGDAAGSSLRRWWQWGWGWFSSKKDGFFRDLETNEGDAMLGYGHRSGWGHVFNVVRAQIKKLMVSNPPIQRFQYDSFNYAKNFDDGSRKEG
uniref:Uncharacterized protein n=2 Tax=Nymphaea colorata TaxID=210225 RepID=A0A5K0V3W9_9MAGN